MIYEIDNAVSYTEDEYSKVWVKNNPALFADSVLKFLEKHPHDSWDFGMTARGGFFTMSATRRPE